MSSTEKVHYGIQSKQTTWVPVYWEQSPDGAEPLCGLRQTLSNLSSTPRISSHARVSSQHLGEGVLTSRHLAAQLAAVDCEIYQSAKFAKNLFIFFLIPVWYCSIIFLSYDMWLILEITFINLVVCWNSFIFLH